MGQYFEYNPNLKKNIHEVRYTYKGNELVFNADNGVFSKDRVDFGTNVLLNSIPDFDGKSLILDMGCGYGVIGLCIAKAYPLSAITMVDVNLRAVELVKENIIKNRINNANALQSNLYDELSSNDCFDVIISNPPIRAGKNIVHGVAKEGYNHLKIGGKIFLVIQKKQGAPSMEKCLFEVFGNVKTLAKENGYFIFESIKEK